MQRLTLRWWLAVVCALLALGASAAHAALFEDDEARRAILEMRQRIDQLQQGSQRSGDDSAQLRRSLLDLQSQIESLRGDIADLRGQNEKLRRDVTDLQQRQKDVAKSVDDRLRKFEPETVQVDGREFKAEPAEKSDYEAALAVFRTGKFPDAVTAFQSFVGKYPQSGYLPSARFWLGNAQYATRAYQAAIDNFKALLASAPDHARAPEAALSIANCQVELKDAKGARKTLEDLIRVYPQSEAATAAKERLSRLK
ncbi:MAG: tol-pal system protein YbgF [Comamonas sp. SCN 65-56]|uniref:tol-pal system protein YbgF n=1 Tax=Comamonas sp. SCN 65-56 TaxID=1660095 RepID=UPI000869C9B8|nr:tol-pal system protein YbgF [Comamonas sp. SCN 65-56]ODS93927.1 MAG: tol-pal system protein YbgF [Comamonas sp. SCN 65-56]